MAKAETRGTRCAIYSRFSSEMQNPRSASDQEKLCRGYAQQHHWDVVLAERDEAVRAGAAASRDGYARLLAAARERRFDVLLVEEISRFSRDFLGGVMELANLRELGVRHADTKHGVINLDDPNDQLRVVFDLMRGQAETGRLGERSKRGLRGQTERKFSSGGLPPYGFKRHAVFSQTRVDPDGRPLREGVRFVLDSIEAPVVRRIFGAYDEGGSKSGIAAALNADHIPSRKAGGTYAGRRNSGTWCTAEIGRILGNPIYVGERLWNRFSRTGPKDPKTGKKRARPNPRDEWITVPGFAEALVDAAVYERVRLRLRADAEKYKRAHVANETSQYLVSGLMRCANCTGSFVIGVHKRGVPHYRCSFRATRGTVVCTNGTTVSQPGLEVRIKRLLDVITKDPVQLEALVREHNKRISSANEGQLAVVRALEARLKAATAERDRFVEAIGLGSGPLPVLVQRVEERTKQTQDLEQQLAQALALVQPLLMPNLRSVTDYVAGGESLFDGNVDRERQFLRQVLDGIYVYGDGTVVVRFREATLFHPVRSVHLHADGAGDAASAGLGATRSLHRDHLEKGLAQFEDCTRKPSAVDMRQVNGVPFYMFDAPLKSVGDPNGN